MNYYIAAGLAGLGITAGLLVGVAEKHVAHMRGEEPIATASALDDHIAAGVCKGGAEPMCYPPECGNDGSECPANNQCYGGKFCYLHSEAEGSGMTSHTCETHGLCDSSRDAEDGFLREDDSTTAVAPGTVVSTDTQPTSKDTERGYAAEKRYAYYY